MWLVHYDVTSVRMNDIYFRWAISINEYFDDLADTLTFDKFIIMCLGLTESEQTLYSHFFLSFTDSQRW